MFITELSIKRPTVSWVMSLILIVFGLFVFWKLPVRELPNGIQPPVVQIQVDYKSASASVVDQEVTQVVEDVIKKESELGRKIILVTHSVEQARRLASEVIFIHAGRVVEHQRACDFFRKPKTKIAQTFLEGAVDYG